MLSEEAVKAIRSFQGPQAVGQALRMAVSMCWMMLPDNRKNVNEAEVEIRRLMDRIFANLREDAKAFGLPEMG